MGVSARIRTKEKKPLVAFFTLNVTFRHDSFYLSSPGSEPFIEASQNMKVNFKTSSTTIAHSYLLTNIKSE